MNLSAECLRYLKCALEREFGVQGKRLLPHLVSLRLSAWSKPSEALDDFCLALQEPEQAELRLAVLESLLNGETRFFRDERVFHFLQHHILPDRAQQSPAIQIWSAACGSGQEAYSLSILAAELGISAHILASDASRQAVAIAYKGEYRLRELEHISSGWCQRPYWTCVEHVFQMEDSLRKNMRFVSLNLTRSWPSLPAQDVILLRNVLIYLDSEHRRHILERAVALLKPQGYLILGATETLVPLPDTLRSVGLPEVGGCFQRR